jgi:hypothetical protein
VLVLGELLPDVAVSPPLWLPLFLLPPPEQAANSVPTIASVSAAVKTDFHFVLALFNISLFPSTLR